MPAAPVDFSAPLSRRMLDERRTAELLFRAVGWACLGGLTVAAMLLTARRAEGMLAAPLSSAPLFVAGMLIALLTWLAQWPHAGRILAPRESPIDAFDVAAFGVPAAIAVLLAAVITLPGTSFGGATGLWSPLIAGQAALLLIHRRRTIAASADLAIEATNDVAVLPDPHTPSSFRERHLAVGDDLSDARDECLAADATQHWTRRTVDGADILEGMARAYFATGARAANVHVGVCPPFAGVPEVFAETMDGPTATVKVAEALPFGVRLEVRLAEPCDADASVVVAIVARM